MGQYRVRVTWKMQAKGIVEAETLWEAYQRAQDLEDQLPGDMSSEYVEGSFEVDKDSLESVEL